MTQRAKVLINCAGPFSGNGEKVVEVCISQNCDYCDITGEPDFYNKIVRKYHQKAKKGGVRIVPACGVDSLPWDLGVLYALKGSTERTYPGVTSVLAYANITVTPSAGTLKSAFSVLANWNFRSIYWILDSWYDFSNRSTRKSYFWFLRYLVPRVLIFPRYSSELKKWVFPVPGLIDMMVVRRTARLLHEQQPSSPDSFHVGQFIAFDSPIAVFLLAIFVWFLLPIILFITKIPPLRRAVLKKIQQGAEKKKK